MADIFISYKKEDRALAESVISLLQDEGFSVWYDERLNPMQSWDATIEAEISSAKAVVVLWTQRSVKSEWVRNEADYGKDHRKLIPLMLEQCDIPLAFRRVQAANLIEWDGSKGHREWKKACNWINAQISGVAPAETNSVADTDLSPLSSRRSPKTVFYWLAGLAVFAVISFYLWSQNTSNPTTAGSEQPANPRLAKAKALFDKAYVLEPRHISARGHIESNNSRLCIASEFQANEWENLLRGLNANEEFPSWSLGFDVEIFKDYLLSGDCLIIGFSEEYKSEVDKLRRVMDEEGKDPPYSIVPFSEMYEDWELGF